MKSGKLLASACAGLMLLTAAPMPVSAATTEEEFVSRIKAAWESHSTSISVRSLGLTLDQVSALYYGTMYTEAKWFYVKPSFSYSISNGKIISMTANYSYSAKDVPAMQTALDNAVAETVAQVHSDWTQAETVLFFHDYLAKNIAYDLTYTYYDAYAAMVNGSSVCQGYALAMCLLCREVGIPCYTLASDDLNHIWNVVQVDGEWYQCDSTFDDGAPDMRGKCTHIYVLCSDAYMMADQEHSSSDWKLYSDIPDISCDSTAYDDAYWVGSIDAVEALDDGSFFMAKMTDPKKVQSGVQPGADFVRFRAGSDPVVIGSQKAAWAVGNGVYAYSYITAEAYGDAFYYNTADQIMSLPLTGGTPTVLYTLTSAEKKVGSLYGLSIDRETGVLTYQIYDAPQFSDSNYTIAEQYGTIQLDVPETTTTSATTTTATTTSATTTSATTTESAIGSLTVNTVVTEETTDSSTTTSTTTTTEALTTLSSSSTTPVLTGSIMTSKSTGTTTSTTPVLTGSVMTSKSTSTTTSTTQTVNDSTTTSKSTSTATSTTPTLTGSIMTSKSTSTATSTTPTLTGSIMTSKSTSTATSTTPTLTGSIMTSKSTSTATSTTPTLTGSIMTSKSTTTATSTTPPLTGSVATSTTTETLLTTLPAPKKLGDLNDDGTLNVKDAVLLARYIGQDDGLELPDQGISNADCDESGNVGTDDLVLLLKAIANLIKLREI